MTEPTDAPRPDPGVEFDPELTADLSAALGSTSFFPQADDEPEHTAEPAERGMFDRLEPADGPSLADETSPYEEPVDAPAWLVPDVAPLAPVEPLPGEPGSAGAALSDLAGGYGNAYEPYYGTPSPWSSDRLEAIMRDTVDAQVQEQRQLETLLLDVREALTRLEDVPAARDETAAPSGAIDRLVTELAAARAEQEQRFADLTARIDALAAAAPEAPETTPGPSIQDLHDGLAGVRTDVTSLPEQIGPAVTSAVAHGLAETTSQVGSLRESLADTIIETTELRSVVAAHADHLSLLPEALSGIADLSTRMTSLEQSAATGAALPVPGLTGPDVTAIVDEQLETHLETFRAGISEQLTGLRAQLSAVEDSLGATVRERLGAFEERLDALHEVLVALHGSEERDLPPALVERLDELEGELRSMRLANEGPTSPITSVVAQLHASEQRLAHHVDEAVLALAQAVLRRRGAGGAAHADEGPAPQLPADEREQPQLPADELAAAARDDIHADRHQPAVLEVADGDSPVERDLEATTGHEDGDDGEIEPPAVWAKGESVGADASDAPGPDVVPDSTSLGQDPRRGLFRRRP